MSSTRINVGFAAWSFLFLFATSTITNSLAKVTAATTQAADNHRQPHQSYKSDPLQFPVPDDGSYVGDPSKILSQSDYDFLVQQLDFYNNQNKLFLTEPPSDGVRDDDRVPIQLAVAVIDRLDPKFYKNDDVLDDDVGEEEMDAIIENAVGRYARAVHDHWGVGHTVVARGGEAGDIIGDTQNTQKESAGDGTGVLLFLDVYDRVVYLSRGAALTKRLNDVRSDKIIDEIRPFLRQAKYGQGLTRGIDAIVEYIQKGDPTWQERIGDLLKIENLFVLIWVFLIGNGVYSKWKQRRDQRLYAQAYSQLSEIDRTHAEALQGNYETKSCPICLESFQSNTVGSDDRPIKLLRCGHVFDESCWEVWVSSGNGDPTKCPVCRTDVGKRLDGLVRSHDDDGAIETVDDRDSQQAESNTQTQEEQQTNPSSSHHTHPSDFPSAAPTTSPTEEPLTIHDESETDNLILSNRDQPHNNHRLDESHERAIRQFQQERNFRLLRLAQMYPRFITSTQLNQWTSPTYHGSMVRDPSFTQRDPMQQYRQQQNSLRNRSGLGGTSQFGNSGFGSGSSSMRFGGGTSAGGRSGRF